MLEFATSASPPDPKQLLAAAGPSHRDQRPTSLRGGARAPAARRGALVKMLTLACCLGAAVCGYAQSPAGTGASDQAASAAKPAGQQVQKVTTTVVVHGELRDDYLPDAVSVGTLEGATLKETPLSAMVVTRDLLSDQAARLLSDVVKNDASIGEDYAPVGYYGDYEIRGFSIDLATGLAINGMTVAGEQDVPLENKERVEFLKGIAGVESGVASAGGLIDYVTKRPAAIKAIDLATDHRGTAYGAIDLGSLFGRQKQLGVRVNLAGESIQSYVNDANGWRAVGAGAADWKLSPKAILKGDFEYQHKVERSVCGYQLLGGQTPLDNPSPPNIDQIYPSTMLGEQAWSKPNTFDTLNAGARLDYDLPRGWKAFAAASYSHSLIDDNVIYAYGCYNEPECVPGTSSPPWLFAPDGTYDIYDYRDPGELRIDAQAEALISGHIKTGAIMQDVTGGVELFLRSAQLPGFFTQATPSTPTIADGAVYFDIGSENLYQPMAVDPPGAADSWEFPLQSAGPRRLYEDNHQTSAVMQDRIHIPGHIQLLIGGREDSLRDHNYSPYATCANFTLDSNNVFETPINCLPKLTDKTVWLPQYAVTFNPINSLTFYGNYGVILSLGLQAPFWTANGSVFLDSFLSRQAEVGAKYEPGQRILLSTAIFHMRAPFFYPENLGSDIPCYPTSTTSDDAPFCFVSEGRETHEGIEFNAEGKATNWLRLTASAAGIRAMSNHTGTPSYDNKQVLNVPRVRTAAFADLAVPHAHGLHLMPGWSYTGRKEATQGRQGERARLQPVQPGSALHAGRRAGARDAAAVCG